MWESQIKKYFLAFHKEELSETGDGAHAMAPQILADQLTLY